jgi:hypothetical protein
MEYRPGKLADHGLTELPDKKQLSSFDHLSKKNATRKTNGISENYGENLLISWLSRR